MRDVAAIIRDRRRQLGWTQAQLASRIGVGREWVIQCEKGKPSIEWGIVIRAFRALELSVDLSPETRASEPGGDELAEILTSRTDRKATS